MLISVSGHTSNLKFDGLNFPPGGAKLFEQKWPSFLTPSGQALIKGVIFNLILFDFPKYSPLIDVKKHAIDIDE